MDPKPDKPSFHYRVMARSHPEIIAAVEGAVTRLGTSGTLKFRGRKMSTEAFINAVLLRAFALPAAELDRLVAAGVADYERLLEGGDLPASSRASSVVIASGSDAPSSEVREPQPHRRARKLG